MNVGSKEEVLRSALRGQSKTTLIEIIIGLSKKVEQVEAQLKAVQKHLEDIERKEHRQAAPFRREESKKNPTPKPPGRKAGHKGTYRKAPEEIDKTIEEPLEGCPKCGGEVADVQPIEQIIEEIPKVSPRRYKLTTYRGKCHGCGEVQSTHPLKTSDATGAAKVQLGPRAKAMALELNYGYGLSKRKTQAVMENICGLSATASGWHYGCWRLSKKCEGDYQQLLQQAQQADYLHSDETSWYMGTPKSWLWVFTNNDQTLYKVADNRAREVIHEVIGHAYKGVLISDCLGIYDDTNPKQQKCYAHHLKAIKQAREKHPEQGKGFLEDVAAMLKQAMLMAKVRNDVPLSNYRQGCKKLEKQADMLLLPTRADPVEEKIANRLRKQRDHLFTFLYEPGIDPTNNLAERQLRPAVIARKISCGNKTRKGADTWQTVVSLLVTNQQTGIDNLEFFQQKACFSL